MAYILRHLKSALSRLKHGFDSRRGHHGSSSTELLGTDVTASPSVKSRL